MSNEDVEKAFKFVFVLAVIVFCVVIIGFFLLAVRFLLNFVPGGFDILGIHMSIG